MGEVDASPTAGSRPATRRRPRLLGPLVWAAATVAGLFATASLPHFVMTESSLRLETEITAGPSGSQSSFFEFKTFDSPYPPAFGASQKASYRLEHIPYWAAPCLAAWTAAATVLRRWSRRPASRWGGAVGFSLAIAAAVEAVRVVQAAAAGAGKPWRSLTVAPERYWCVFWLELPGLAGCTTAAWWLALALAGGRRSERTATGRMGIALGWCWIAAAVAKHAGVWLLARGL